MMHTCKNKRGRVFTGCPSHAHEQQWQQPLLVEAAGRRRIASRQEPKLSKKTVGNSGISKLRRDEMHTKTEESSTSSSTLRVAGTVSLGRSCGRISTLQYSDVKILGPEG